jgi:hypothetical protein
MLRGNLLSGALRWKVTFTPELVAQEAAMANWKSAWIELAGIKSANEVTAEVARVLGFPDFFSGEIESIKEFLGDAVPEDSGLLIGISGWQEFAKFAPSEATRFAEVLDASVVNLSAVAIFCDPSGNLAGLAELSLA